jgi:hypothetical protein
MRTALIYWFLLCFIVGMIAATVRTKDFLASMSKYAEMVSQNLPAFSISNGRVIAENPEMVSITNTNNFPIVLDPGNTITRPPPGYTNGMFHIGKDRISVWLRPEGDPLIVPLRSPSILEFPDGKVDKEYVERFGKKFSYFMAPFMLVVLTLIFYLTGLLQAFFFAILVAFLEKAIRPTFTFEEILNISIYALTPAVLVVSVYWLWGVRVLPYDLIYFFTYLIFHVMASGACRRSLMPPGEDELE